MFNKEVILPGISKIFWEMFMFRFNIFRISMFLGWENQQISLLHKAELWASDQLSVVTKGNESYHLILSSVGNVLWLKGDNVHRRNYEFIISLLILQRLHHLNQISQGGEVGGKLSVQKYCTTYFPCNK